MGIPKQRLLKIAGIVVTLTASILGLVFSNVFILRSYCILVVMLGVGLMMAARRRGG